MDTYRAQVVADWLRALRGSATQDVFLADLEREIGWAPHRPNLSKYENGHAIPEPETLARFVAYADKKGKPAPDFTPPAPAVDPIVAAMDRQTEAIAALAAALLSWKSAAAGQADAVADGLALIAAKLEGLVPSGDGDDEPRDLSATNHRGRPA